MAVNWDKLTHEMLKEVEKRAMERVRETIQENTSAGFFSIRSLRAEDIWVAKFIEAIIDNAEVFGVIGQYDLEERDIEVRIRQGLFTGATETSAMIGFKYEYSENPERVVDILRTAFYGGEAVLVEEGTDEEKTYVFDAKQSLNEKRFMAEVSEDFSKWLFEHLKEDTELQQRIERLAKEL